MPLSRPSLPLPPLDANVAARLTAAERAIAATYRHAQRRDEWVIARLLAKDLLRERLCDRIDDQDVSILPDRVTGRPQLIGTEPELHTRLQPLDISITHAGRHVAVAIASDERVGVDLVRPGDIQSDRLRPWFTPAEQTIAETESLTLADLWAMKEAAYKATSGQRPFRPADYPVTAERGWTCGHCGVLLQLVGELTIAIACPDRTLLREADRLWFARRRLSSAMS